MSARITGPAVVTNPRLPQTSSEETKSKHLLLDAHFFLTNGNELTVLLKYFNENNIPLHDPADPDAGVVVVLEATVVVTSPDARIEGSSLTPDELREYQLYGDVTWMYPANIDPRVPPYINAIGITKAVNRDDATFKLDATQWSPIYPRNHPSAQLPLRVLIPTSKRFPDPKKICPSKHSWTYVSGRASKFSTSSNGYLDRLDINLGSIAYMGKYISPYTPSDAKTPDGPSGSKRKSFDFAKFDEIEYAPPETPLPAKKICRRDASFDDAVSSCSISSLTS
ncbi:hypothetical protein AB1N83_014287 [Pleurotus pulmonarius]|nr:hypothetical protein EYR36_006239 [Pleurotus pulmonarius]KAF4600946.1 hypothetical protein EYR38_005592 [Pleurotus pulmonarius]